MKQRSCSLGVITPSQVEIEEKYVLAYPSGQQRVQWIHRIARCYLHL